MRLTVPGRAVITTTPVGESDRLAQVVSDEDDRLARSIPQLEELILQEKSRLGVERAERLVHQDDLGVVHERADDVRALAHPPRQLVWIVILEAGEAHALDEGGRAGAPLAPRDATDLQRELHVLAQGPPRIEVVALGHV